LKRRIVIFLLIMALICISGTSVLNITSAAGSLKIQMYNSNTATTLNSISPVIKLINQGSAAINLSTVTIRYYYTVDGDKTQNYWCDHAAITSPSYTAITSNVTGKFVKLDTAVSGADYYLEIGFTSGAGSLAAGAAAEIQSRFAKNDWTNYTQTGDYSFNSSATSFVDWTNVTAYVSGNLQWGTEPGGSTATPTATVARTPTPTGASTATPTPTVTPTPTPVTTATPTATTTTSPSSNALFIGRFDTSDPAGPKSAWSATTIKANFTGTGISANLVSTGDNWYNVIIDGIVKTPVNIPSGTNGSVTLASGLTSGTHTIEFVRRTEAWVGDVQFKGFTVTGGNLLAPPSASTRRIEFIGDSITCGYGNEGTSQYQNFTTKNENAYLAYGSVAARALGADQITVSWSGKGVIRNYGGDTNEMMPQIYPRILPYNTTLTWNPSQWIPQVVVINLCTNDFSIGVPDKTTFTTTYAKFVNQLRSQYSDAHIYCAVGPMLNGDNLTNARDFINTVVNQLKSAGDSKIHFIEFPMQDGSLGYGEDWHPSVATHAQMANQLVQQIKTDLGW
jgi:lysophospholipase L1-like esterase